MFHVGFGGTLNLLQVPLPGTGLFTPLVCLSFMLSVLAVHWRNQDPEGSGQEGGMKAGRDGEEG